MSNDGYITSPLSWSESENSQENSFLSVFSSLIISIFPTLFFFILYSSGYGYFSSIIDESLLLSSISITSF